MIMKDRVFVRLRSMGIFLFDFQKKYEFMKNIYAKKNNIKYGEADDYDDFFLFCIKNWKGVKYE